MDNASYTDSPETAFRTGRHVVHLLHAHLVLTTKYRRDAITTDRVRDSLRSSMQGVCGDFGVELQAWEAEDDHVHLLIAYPPKVALSKLVNALKGASSYRLRGLALPEVRKVLWGSSFWSPSYCIVSCDGAPLETIKAYVETQRDPERSRRGQKARAAAKAARMKRKKKTP